jgi:hypothetical protein
MKLTLNTRRSHSNTPSISLAWERLVLALALICGCAEGGATVSRHRTTETPAASREHTFPDVVACDVAESGGSIHLLLGKASDADDTGFTLTYTRSDDGGASWRRPTPVPTDHATPARMHRGDDPQIAANGLHVMALWTARGDGPYGSGPLATALSDDGGRTWRAGPAPSARPLPADATPQKAHSAASASTRKPREATGPGYRFPAAAAGPGAFHVVWIHAAGDERSLRHAALPFGAASWSPAAVVDPHVCACCWNELTVGRDGTILALYRDQQPSDMSLSLSRDGGVTWQPAGRAGPFNWNFDGCPHVGGGIASAADTPGTQATLATVWTGNAAATGAYVVARDGRGSWSSPAPLAAGGFKGRDTDIAALPGTSTAVAVWDQSAPEGGGQCVYSMTTTDGGRRWAPPHRLSSPGVNAAYPRVVPAGSRFIVLWTRYATEGSTDLQIMPLDPL